MAFFLTAPGKGNYESCYRGRLVISLLPGFPENYNVERADTKWTHSDSNRLSEIYYWRKAEMRAGKLPVGAETKDLGDGS